MKKEEEEEERDQAAAVTQQSISWNRKYTTQITDCHQPCARKKSRYVKEQIGRMVTAEVKEPQSLRGRSSKRAEQIESNEGITSFTKETVFRACSTMQKPDNNSITIIEAQQMVKILVVCKPSAANIYFIYILYAPM